MKPQFINGFWRAVVKGHIQPECYNTYIDALQNCKAY